MLIGEAATIEDEHDKVVMINGVPKAFFEAPARREVCIELPEEEFEIPQDGNDYVGYLEKSLYGTRDAAANFQQEIKMVMEKAGFSRGKYNASTYHHKDRQLKTMVHGDDFVTTGNRENIHWFQKQLEGRFEIKTTVVGSRKSESTEARILNRIVRRTAQGWEYEADQRHADIIVQSLGLNDATGLSTPGEPEKHGYWNNRMIHSKRTKLPSTVP